MVEYVNDNRKSISMEIEEIGRRIKDAVQLDNDPICVREAQEPPEGAVPLSDMHRCIAAAIFQLSRNGGSGYVDQGSLSGCCPGGQAWLGFKDFAHHLKYFVSTGKPDFRGGTAEYLKDSPEGVERSIERLGEIRNTSECLVIQPCADGPDKESVKNIVVFAQTARVMNLCTLLYFGTSDPLSVITPWGPMCTHIVTYPAGMVDRFRQHAILGTVDPTVRDWFPSDHLSLGLPLSIAERMAEDVDQSFLKKGSSH